MKVTIASISREQSGDPSKMLATLKHVSSMGLSACVADRGSSQDFIDSITSMGHEVIPTDNGLRGQMEAAFEAAAQRGTHVLYMESDKYQFATTALAATIESYRRRGLEHAIVGRTQTRFDTYPPAQRAVEIAQNELISATTGIAGDWVFGPRLLPSEQVAALKDCQFYGTADHGWGVPWYLLGRACRAGVRVGLIKTGTPVEPDVRDEFNPGYRLFQAYSILGCFYEGAGIPYDWNRLPAR